MDAILQGDDATATLVVQEGIQKGINPIKLLKQLKPTPKILVGGLAFNGQHRLADEIGADSVAQEGLNAVQVARELMSLETNAPSLQEYLKQLGQRVQALRKSHGWNQQQLAKASGIDRTYISVVEHGKQNITIGAISKLSEALNVPITHY